MGTQNAQYICFVEDMTVQSYSNGAGQTFVITPSQYFPMGLNLSALYVGLRIKNPDATVGVTTKAEWSLDGKNWKSASSTVITEKSAADDYTGGFTAAAEVFPYVRVIVTVRDTALTAMKTAQITVWGYYLYRV